MYNATKVPTSAYTASTPTNRCEIDQSTVLNATNCINEPRNISRKWVDLPVKVLMSSLMR